MISFRYFLITIVAIFLALGLGVLAGSTVLEQSLVDGLQAQTDRLQADLNDLRGQATEQRVQLDKLNEYSDAVLPVLVRGRLVGRQVVVITDQGAIDDGLSDRVIDALRTADADVVAALRIDPRMGVSTPQTRNALAAAIGAPAATSSRVLQEKAAAALARRLARADQPPDDILGRLQDAGFITDLLGSAAPEEVGGANQSVVVVHGGQQDQLPRPSDFLVPLVEELVATQRLDVAAAEGTGSQPEFVRELRGSNLLEDRQFVTVDDVDLGMGQVALDLGLQRLLEFGEGGDYGLEAADIFPPLEPGA
jgi:copper transport outer membrane protein MctB